MVKLEDNIGNVLAAFGGLSDVLVVGEDSKPLGILYKAELLAVLPSLDKLTDDDKNLLLRSKLSDINNHLLIPNRKWDVQKGTIDNFARVSPDDNLLLARERCMPSVINSVMCDVLLQM
ncbi:MAG TPA: hypothetical protein VFI70_07075 [Nitrososphaeraceae archaeon]|nr:hypothetical protein [Nitrososphaeraceae archaeon]